MVVHVELHLRDDAAEIGNEAAEHPGLVHPAQHQVGIAAVLVSTSRKKALAAGSSRTCVDQPRIARGGAHRRRDGFPARRARRARTSRSAAPDPRRRSRRAGSPAARGRARSRRAARAAADASAGRSGGPCSANLLVELGEEQAGQVADRLRVEEIELHEALDRRFARAGRRSASRAGDLALMSNASRSSARPAARWRWQRTAQKKRSARSNRRNSAAVSSPCSTRSAGALDPEGILADPVERVEVAQAALAVLDVGLDDVAAVAHAAVALVALGELGGDDSRARCRRRPRCGSGAIASSNSASSPQIQRASSIAVRIVMSLVRQRDHLVDGAHRLADLQLQVPQQIEHRLDDLLAPRRAAIGDQKHQVDVAERRHLAAPAAAEPDQRDPLARASGWRLG